MSSEFSNAVNNNIAIQVRHKAMSQEEAQSLLEKKYWTLFECVHFVLAKKIEFPWSFIKSSIMEDLQLNIQFSSLRSLPQNSDIGPLVYCFEDSLLVGVHPWGMDRHYVSDEFLEWAIEGLPFARQVQDTIGIAIPSDRLYENLDDLSQNTRNGLSDYCFGKQGYQDEILREDSKNIIKQQAVAQMLAYECGYSFQEVIEDPRFRAFVPGGKYFPYSRRPNENLVEIFPKSKRGHRKQRRREVEALSCVFTEDFTRLRLREFKIVVTTIFQALKNLYPTQGIEEVIGNKLIKCYLNRAPSIVNRMIFRWIDNPN